MHRIILSVLLGLLLAMLFVYVIGGSTGGLAYLRSIGYQIPPTIFG